MRLPATRPCTAAELAATRPSAPLVWLVRQLGHRHQRLDLLSSGGDPRTAVRAVFSWSYQHLDRDSARAFRLLGLYPGTGIEPHAGAALMGTTVAHARRLLMALARAHLITRPTRRDTPCTVFCASTRLNSPSPVTAIDARALPTETQNGVDARGVGRQNVVASPTAGNPPQATRRPGCRSGHLTRVTALSCPSSAPTASASRTSATWSATAGLRSLRLSTGTGSGPRSPPAPRPWDKILAKERTHPQLPNGEPATPRLPATPRRHSPPPTGQRHQAADPKARLVSTPNAPYVALEPVRDRDVDRRQ